MFSRIRAFTLVELLAVVAIVSVLAAMLLPAIEHSVTQAQLIGCRNQLRQQYLMTITYAQDHGDWLPEQNAMYNFNVLLYTNCSYGTMTPDDRRLVNMGLFVSLLGASVDLFFCPERGMTPADRTAWQALAAAGFRGVNTTFAGQYAPGWEYGYHPGQGKYVGYPASITSPAKGSVTNYARQWRILIADQNDANAAYTAPDMQRFPHNGGEFLNVVNTDGRLGHIRRWGDRIGWGTLPAYLHFGYFSNAASWKNWWSLFGPGTYTD